MYLDMVRIGEKSDGKLLILIMYLQKEKEKRYKVTLWKEKKWKVEKKCNPKKYIMKWVVAKIRMGQKDIICPNYVLY